ncbi:hypothetical protein L1267_11070 [Pseudoalteromonas sp. OFAV1]|jgi:hypothetical protein|uniref:hypothetical protein n=1 Tax=Pseudoalteromonas sp. OFAV1 TaxID=2908892 RepID=UPI001F293D41|nr:hypothetical protein [Pseudoalteromonas sp. OFAV1]MCF2900945.1 hypothetical protein [Pseudoalteromonas sp. OFAV1]
MLLKDFKGQKVKFTIIKDQYSDNIEEGYKEMSWDDFKTLMSRSKGLYKKDESEQLIPVIWKPRNEWAKDDDLSLTNAKKTYRNSLNITHITTAFLDLDEEGSLEQAKQKFQGFDYLIHSTFSGKHRMAIRLEKPIRSDVWENCFIHLMAGVNGDANCKNISRGYLMPSHDLNTGFKPEFEVNEGRALTYDDIISLGKRNLSSKDIQMLEKLDERAKNGDSNIIKRHFSLQVMDYSKYNGDALSYEQFKRRRAKQIEDCITDPLSRGAVKGERHAFALKVIQSEVLRFKENTDFYRTIQFLFRVTQELDTRPLSFGNTADEIPGIIENSLLRSGIDKETLKDPTFLRNAKIQIRKGLDFSLKSEDTGVWDFPDFTMEKRGYSTEPHLLLKRYASMVDKYRVEMHEKSATATDVRSLSLQLFQEHIAKPIIQNELKSNTNASFVSIGRFLAYSLKNLRVCVEKDRKNVFESMSNAYSNGLSASNLSDSVIGKSVSADEIKADFTKSYLIELASDFGGIALSNKRNQTRTNNYNSREP